MAAAPPQSVSAVTGRRGGFTLLEVLLTLLLTSLVLVAVAMAIDFQLRVVERSRGHVEEAQLARVLLHRIADDLRGAVPYDPLGMEDLVAEVASSAAATAAAAVDALAGGGAAAPDGGSAADSEGSGPDESDTEDVEEVDDSEPDELAESAGTGESSVPRSVPGVYGGSDWLQVDVGRLPRLDQFEYLVTSTEGSTTLDRLSDVKTVTYYVLSPENAGTSNLADGTESGGGLVRRELDRAVSSWASDQGQLDTTESDVTPIASEVYAIAFRYWDGSEWVEEWDSDEAGAFPLAVEITLTVTPIRQQSGQTSSWQTSTSTTDSEEEDLLTYSLIVHLQAAAASSGGETGEMEETSEATEESAATGDTTESSSSQTGSGNEEPPR